MKTLYKPKLTEPVSLLWEAFSQHFNLRNEIEKYGNVYLYPYQVKSLKPLGLDQYLELETDPEIRWTAEICSWFEGFLIADSVHDFETLVEAFRFADNLNPTEDKQVFVLEWRGEQRTGRNYRVF
jgi:hypothetical protein